MLGFDLGFMYLKVQKKVLTYFLFNKKMKDWCWHAGNFQEKIVKNLSTIYTQGFLRMNPFFGSRYDN